MHKEIWYGQQREGVTIKQKEQHKIIFIIQIIIISSLYLVVHRISNEQRKYKTETIPLSISEGSGRWVWSESKVAVKASSPKRIKMEKEGRVLADGIVYTRKESSPCNYKKIHVHVFP